MNQNLKYALIILILALVIIGGFILVRNYRQATSTAPADKPPLNQTPNNTLQTPGQGPKKYVNESDLLNNIPSNDSSEQEKEEFTKAIRAYIKTGDLLVIKDCLGKPIVLSVKAKSTINIQNQDTKEHTLVFGEKTSIQVSPNATRSIVLDFLKEGDLRNYQCDGANSGFFIVAPQ